MRLTNTWEVETKEARGRPYSTPPPPHPPQTLYHRGLERKMSAESLDLWDAGLCLRRYHRGACITFGPFKFQYIFSAVGSYEYLVHK